MLKPIDATALKLEASRVRGAFEKHRREFRNHPLLSGFPRGSCGAAVELLGHWLIERGFDGVLVTVCTATPSHVWNEVAGTIVDITADQFPDGPSPVYIGKLTPCQPKCNSDRDLQIRKTDKNRLLLSVRFLWGDRGIK